MLQCCHFSSSHNEPLLLLYKKKNIWDSQGFRKVFNVAGGIHEYAVKVDPSIPTY